LKGQQLADDYSGMKWYASAQLKYMLESSLSQKGGPKSVALIDN